ncbi:MAG: PASTA domain-containing protein, partial [Desulfobulbaceae bacterium]|nr:PASTA domain-containing protein [Desulfobulbaceae bacterium]
PETQQKSDERKRVSIGRKNIFDKRFKRLAISFRLSSVYARPLEFEKTSPEVPQLAALLGFSETELLKILMTERSFVWLGLHISQKTAEEIAGLHMKGIHLIEKVHRLYPVHQTAAHVVGFFREEQGLSGIEFYYDALLRGGSPYDSEGKRGGPEAAESVTETGADLVLTLDLDSQKYLEKMVKGLLKKTKANSGMALLMDLKTGEILSLVNQPAYDPNRFWDFSEDRLRNRALVDPVFPGGLNALFLLAAALDSGQAVASRNARELQEGAQGKAADGQPLKTKTSEASFRPGSDPGVYVSAEISAIADLKTVRQDYDDFISKIGFNRKSGIDLPGEDYLDELGTYRPDDSYSTTSAVHLLAAFSRLINGGKSFTPHLLKSIWAPGEAKLVPARHEQDGAVVDPEVSNAFLELLDEVTGNKDSDAFLFESLVRERPVRRFVIDEPGDETQQGESVNSFTLEISSDRLENGKRFQAVMLGCAPRERPEIAIVVVLDGAEIDLGTSSPVRRVVRKILPKLMKEKSVKGRVPEKAFFETDERAAYSEWMELQKADTEQSAFKKVQPVEKMPDVIGLSLRKALQVLQPYGLGVKVTGAGRVVRQEPAIGARLTGGECVLELGIGH